MEAKNERNSGSESSDNQTQFDDIHPGAVARFNANVSAKQLEASHSSTDEPKPVRLSFSARMKQRMMQEVRSVDIWKGIDRSDDWDVHTVGSFVTDDQRQQHDNEKHAKRYQGVSMAVSHPDSSWYGLQKYKFFRSMNPPVFFSATVLLLVFVAVFGAKPEWGTKIFIPMRDGIATYLGWFYVVCINALLISLVYIACSKYGDIRLGPDGSVPEFSGITWVSMMFSAGMGIGIVFYGPGEPLSHYVNPPNPWVTEEERFKQAVPLTLFNWCFHAWCSYAMMGLAIAYYSHRLRLPCSIRSAVYPILGRWTFRWPGHLVDTFAMFASVFGLATSLGLGALQINAGLNYISEDSIPVEYWVQAVVIAVVTGCAVLSLISGLTKGIRILSNVNMIAATILMFAVWFINDPEAEPQGSTQNIMRGVVSSVSNYMVTAITRSTDTGFGTAAEDSWMASWTLYYYGWFLSWSPFVSVFLAKISYGRSVREFIVVAMTAPLVISVLWFNVFGLSAIYTEKMWVPSAETCRDCVDLVGAALVQCRDEFSCPRKFSDVSVDVQLFEMYSYYYNQRDLISYPTMMFLMVMSILVLAIFFVSSSDSGSMVIDMLGNGGQEPVLWQKLFWAILEGGVAVVLLGAGAQSEDSAESLSALQAMVVALGLPMAILYFFITAGLLKTFARDDGRITIRTGKSAEDTISVSG